MIELAGENSVLYYLVFVVFFCGKALRKVSPFILTKVKKGFIIMAREFDESKVKRDRLGQFAEMSAKEISGTIKQEIGDHKYIQAVNGRVSHNALTENQWRLWYQEKTQKEKSFLLDKIDERRLVNVEGIFVLTGGTFSEPIVEAVYKFRQDEESKEFASLLESRYEQYNQTSND